MDAANADINLTHEHQEHRDDSAPQGRNHVSLRRNVVLPQAGRHPPDDRPEGTEAEALSERHCREQHDQHRTPDPRRTLVLKRGDGSEGAVWRELKAEPGQRSRVFGDRLENEGPILPLVSGKSAPRFIQDRTPFFWLMVFRLITLPEESRAVTRSESALLHEKAQT